jgi:hypothetical protein
MNIAVAVPEQIKQFEAHKARRARMAANAWKPKLIECAPKTVTKYKGHKITVNQNQHVVTYDLYCKAIQHSKRMADQKSSLKISDIQHFALFNSWQLLDVTAPARTFSLGDIKGQSRVRDIALVRQTAMFICKEFLEKKSFPEIGREFGKRDHTTVLHAHRKIKNLILSRQLLMNGKPFNLDRIGEI